jgi:hypothetical protein
MNCIEKLFELHKYCEPCTAKIIEFEQLPEHEKFNYDYYDKVKDFIVYCEQCNEFKIIEGDNYENR